MWTFTNFLLLFLISVVMDIWSEYAPSNRAKKIRAAIAFLTFAFAIFTLMIVILGQPANGQTVPTSDRDTVEVELLSDTTVAEEAEKEPEQIFGIPSSLKCTYGESPTSSGLTCDAAWNEEAVTVSLNAAQGYLMWLPLHHEFGGGWSLTLGPAAGFNSQVPFASAFAALSASTGTTFTTWNGVAAGDVENGPSFTGNIFFLYGDVSQTLPYNLVASVALLKFEDGDWNTLPSLTWTPAFRDGGNFLLSVTGDTNAKKLLFAIGFGLELR